MKISLVLLFVIAFAALMQVPVSDAEESSTSTSSSLAERNAKSSTLIRRKRWGWWGLVGTLFFMVALVVLVTVPLVAKVAAGVLLATKAMKIGGALINCGAYGFIAINNAVSRRSFASSDTKTMEDNVDFNLEIIDKFINQNYEDNNPLKVKIEEEYPELSESVQFSKHGFKCDQNFCDKHGNGIHAFGVCSPHACECGVNGAEQRMCEEHSVYDPVYQTCEDPLQVKICGS